MTKSGETTMAIKRPPPAKEHPADLIVLWTPMLKRLEPDLEIDYSFAKDAITMCDMRRPSALRYGNLYTGEELDRGEYRKVGDIERRVRSFMAQG